MGEKASAEDACRVLPPHFLTVTRGGFYKRDRWTELKDEITYTTMESFEAFKEYMLSKPGCCESYAGIRHKNIFRVNKPIVLQGFGFFGPHYEHKAVYKVSIDIENGDGHSVRKFVDNDALGKKGDIFDVHLPEPVVIVPMVYYTIHFQLDGPDTDFCPLEKLKTEVGNFCGDQLAFQFHLGSKQMPFLYYTLP